MKYVLSFSPEWKQLVGAGLASVALTVMIASLPTAWAKEFSIGTEHTNDFRPAAIIESPRPEIPSDMHDECFKSFCVARFVINPDGKTQVKLVSSTGNEDLDEIALKTLKQWKFKPATLNGEPISSTRRLKIEFEVE